MTETDYLVVGAGTAGMTITDMLLAHTDAHITLIDRRHAPGGHWVDAYPFVRLHQPSAFYGVPSVPIEPLGPAPDPGEPGTYSRASADELRAYFARVLNDHFLPSGRVRFLPATEHAGEEAGIHHLRNRLSGEMQTLRARRKWVDTTYLEGAIPATSPPPFAVAEDARCVPVGDLAHVREAPARCVIVGGGKTALDAIVWLLGQGLSPERIQWIKPREGWWLNRRHFQPLEGLPDFYDGVARQVEAIARASSVAEVFTRLEADGVVLRVEPSVESDMCHGAIASQIEIDQLRRVRDVVRLGHVRRIDRDRIVLDNGSVPTSADNLHVHCAAQGLARPPLRPVFEPGRITVQPLFWGFASVQFAHIGAVEALVDSDDERNRLCRPIAYWDTTRDYLAAFQAGMASERAQATHPALAAWSKRSRLHNLSALGPYRQHPTVMLAQERLREWGMKAAQNLPVLLGAAPRG